MALSIKIDIYIVDKSQIWYAALHPVHKIGKQDFYVDITSRILDVYLVHENHGCTINDIMFKRISIWFKITFYTPIVLEWQWYIKTTYI